MKRLESLPTLLSILIAIACVQISAFGQSADSRFASVNTSGQSVRFDMAVPGDGTVTIATPDGRIFRKEFSGGSPEFSLSDQGERLPDGQYTYELRINPTLSAMSK